MQYRVCRKAIVPYSDEQMYALVYDIASYSEFVPWCTKGYIDSVEGDQVLGVLVFSRFGMQYTLKTLNTCTEYSQIALSLVEGPLDKLHGAWKFQSTDTGCEVSLELDVVMHSYGLNMLFSSMFDTLSKQLVHIFVQRAKKVYGKSTTG